VSAALLLVLVAAVLGYFLGGIGAALMALIAGAVCWGAERVAQALEAARAEAAADRALRLLQTFSQPIAAARHDPRVLITWQPLAQTARQLAPDAFAALDRAAGGTFPFTAEAIKDAHAQWTADWLAWERAHDAEFKLRAASAEQDLTASGGAPMLRATLDAVEREKLETYQRRYEEYIRVAKALQALAPQ
jgi:hypothetical protein